MGVRSIDWLSCRGEKTGFVIMTALTFWISFVLIVVLAFVCAPPGVAGNKKRHGKGKDSSHLPDASYLSIPRVLAEMERRDLVYNESGVMMVWTVERIINKFKDNTPRRYYCPELIYMTLDLDREPNEIVHRRCDLEYVKANHCLTDTEDGRSHKYTCMDQSAFRKVLIKRRRKYQRVFIGCTCSATEQTDR